jgi:hypothetical protein
VVKGKGKFLKIKKRRYFKIKDVSNYVETGHTVQKNKGEALVQSDMEWIFPLSHE